MVYLPVQFTIYAFVFIFGVTFCPQSKAYNPLEDEEKTVYVLSIDGGGMRGMVPAKMLEEMESRLGKNLRIAECFDLITGTSTGGILALGLSLIDPKTGRPKYSASELKALYSREMGQKIFPSSKRKGSVMLRK